MVRLDMYQNDYRYPNLILADEAASEETREQNAAEIEKKKANSEREETAAGKQDKETNRDTADRDQQKETGTGTGEEHTEKNQSNEREETQDEQEAERKKEKEDSKENGETKQQQHERRLYVIDWDRYSFNGVSYINTRHYSIPIVNSRVLMTFSATRCMLGWQLCVMAMECATRGPVVCEGEPLTAELVQREMERVSYVSGDVVLQRLLAEATESCFDYQKIGDLPERLRAAVMREDAQS